MGKAGVDAYSDTGTRDCERSSTGADGNKSDVVDVSPDYLTDCAGIVVVDVDYSNDGKAAADSRSAYAGFLNKGHSYSTG